MKYLPRLKPEYCWVYTGRFHIMFKHERPTFTPHPYTAYTVLFTDPQSFRHLKEYLA